MQVGFVPRDGPREPLQFGSRACAIRLTTAGMVREGVFGPGEPPWEPWWVHGGSAIITCTRPDVVEFWRRDGLFMPAGLGDDARHGGAAVCGLCGFRIPPDVLIQVVGVKWAYRAPRPDPPT